MFKIHDLRVKQNYDAFDVICKKEEIGFFTLNNLVILLQDTLDYGENVFEKRIEFSRVKNKRLLDRLVSESGKILFDMSDDAFIVLPEIYFMLEEIYNIQKENDQKYKEYNSKYGNLYFWPKKYI